MTRLVAVLLMLGLAGCAEITEPLGMEDPFAIPQPFQGVERNDRMIAQAIAVPAVIVETPVGLGIERATALRDLVVAEAQKRDVPALAEPTSRGWVLRANAATLRTADAKGKPVDQVVVTWRLSDLAGYERTQFAVSSPGDESALTQVALGALAEQTAAHVEQAPHQPRTQALEAAAPAANKPVVWVGAIKGAPGDGNKALSDALGAILPLKGIRIERAKAKAQWQVEGQIKLETASATQDIVTLSWRVLDAKGREAGTIRQQNPVPKGSLSKSWGRVASFAAEAAAEGIAQLIQQVTAPTRT